MFKLYTQENCPNCEAMKNFLNSNNITFEEVDVNKDFKARAFMTANDLEETPALVNNGVILVGNVDVVKDKVVQLV